MFNYRCLDTCDRCHLAVTLVSSLLTSLYLGQKCLEFKLKCSFISHLYLFLFIQHLTGRLSLQKVINLKQMINNYSKMFNSPWLVNGCIIQNILKRIQYKCETSWVIHLKLLNTQSQSVFIYNQSGEQHVSTTGRLKLLRLTQLSNRQFNILWVHIINN